jgi:lambda family phage portal protein
MAMTILDLSEARAAIKTPPKTRVRGYDAAKQNRILFDWAHSVLSFDKELQGALPVLRGRSREMSRNDPTTSKFISLVLKNVLGGDGIKLQSKIMMQRSSGGQLKPNEMQNRIIEESWKEWTKKQNCSYNRRFSWWQFSRIVLRRVVVDGEAIIWKHEAPTNPFGFSLESIDPERLDFRFGENAPAQLPNGGKVRFGIEFGTTGEVVAYHILDRPWGDTGGNARTRQRVPADQIIHVFLPLSDDQTRGVPWATPSMLRLQYLKGYMEAEEIAARVGAMTMGFITKQLPTEGTEVDPNSEHESLSNGGQTIEAQAGMFMPLAPGEGVSMFDPKHPVSAYGEFVSGCKLDIAAGLDVAYMSLSGDVGAANYSSARVGLLDERETWYALQQWFIEEVCEPVFESWLRISFLTFLKGLPGSDWRAYNYPCWHPKKFAWIDPLKDVQASILAIGAGLTTRTRELASQGYDFQETMDELADEDAYIKEKGLLLATDPKLQLSATNQPSDPPAKPGAPRLLTVSHRDY